MLRLADCATGTRFIVDLASGTAYADTREEGWIGRGDAIAGALAERVLASAREHDALFELAVPGNRTPDGKFEVRGALTRQERRAFAEGGDVLAERAALLLHLDFFDRDLDGMITPAENYRGWRRLGFSGAAAAVKAALAAVLFGRIAAGLSIDVERIAERRYARATGIYDRAGALDHSRLDSYDAAFEAAGGTLSFEETRRLIDAQSSAGAVSRGQFRSLFSVCERVNRGERVVTQAQFRGLFDGSLLWLAEATVRPA
jgi:hypothetical protein